MVTPPLGYRPNGRTLAIVDDHAEMVRDIYLRYAEVGNVRLVAEQLVRDGIKSPDRISGAGRRFGGRHFTRGQIYHMLKNPIYVGEIEHRGQMHAGQHPPIIDRALWDEVQQQLKVNLRGARCTRAANPSPLSGKLFDHDGEPLIPVHACKGRVRYRYYVSRALQHDGAIEGTVGMRVPAREIEAQVTELLVGLFNDPAAVAGKLRVTAADYPALAARCDTIAQDLRQRKTALAEFADQVRLLPDRIELEISTARLAAELNIAISESTPTITVSADVRLKRSGGIIRLVRADGRPSEGSRPHSSLINLVARGHHWWKQLTEGECDITELARIEGVTASYITRVVRLAFLSPTVVDAVLQGRQRPDVTITGLTIGADVSMLWSAQADWLV